MFIDLSIIFPDLIALKECIRMVPNSIHILGTRPSDRAKFSGYYSHLNRLVHEFAAKFEDPYEANYAGFCRL